ncbi:hypothetical protein U1Q18_044037, partial [Sarracenia purpurea var. burkii]
CLNKGLCLGFGSSHPLREKNSGFAQPKVSKQLILKLRGSHEREGKEETRAMQTTVMEHSGFVSRNLGQQSSLSIRPPPASPA